MEYFRRFILWFISGLGLGVGVAVVVWSSTKLQEREKSSHAENSLASTSVAISSVEPIEVTEHIAAAAVLENRAATNVGVEIELALLKDAKVIYTCERHAPSTPGPGKSQRIQVECRGVQRGSVPAGAVYEVRVRRVWSLP